MSDPSPDVRTVSCSLLADVLAPAAVELQVAVAGPAPADEQLVVLLDGEPLPVRELATTAGGRLHLVDVPTGRLHVAYQARVGARSIALEEPLERSTYLRPSRYAPSDRLLALARAELPVGAPPADLVRLAAAWVGTRLRYVLGSSTGTDGAIETLLAGQGVCRDYAHLVVALLRAVDVPARLVSAYAPGLTPMDFHAVAEALVDGAWWAVDPTALAPRSALVRIATGRDAADTAFLASTGGEVRLEQLQVSAVVEGALPGDDLNQLVQLS